MPNNKVITGAIAIIKVNGVAVGKMKDIRVNENFRRVRVGKGLGSIFADEFALVEWLGTVSCSFFEIDYAQSGVRNAVRRVFGSSILSQIASGNNQVNFEDQHVLDEIGVDLDIYKKLTDVVDPTGIITPKTEPYATLGGMFIDSDNVSITEANIAGRDQSFSYLRPVIVT